MSTWKQEAADCHTWIHGRCVEKTAVRGPKKQEERKHCLGVKLLRPDLQHSADRRPPKHSFLGMIKHEYGVRFSGEKFRTCFSFHYSQVNSELRWLTGSPSGECALCSQTTAWFHILTPSTCLELPFLSGFSINYRWLKSQKGGGTSKQPSTAGMSKTRLEEALSAISVWQSDRFCRSWSTGKNLRITASGFLYKKINTVKKNISY